MKLLSMLRKKGQLSIVNIIMFVVLVFVAAVLSPIINGVIIQVINDTANLSATTILVMNVILPLFWLGIIITFFMYVTPIRPQSPY